MQEDDREECQSNNWKFAAMVSSFEINLLMVVFRWSTDSAFMSSQFLLLALLLGSVLLRLTWWPE